MSDALGSLGSLAVSLEANMATFNADMNRAGQVVQKFGEQLDSVRSLATSAFAGIGAAAAAVSFTNSIKGAIESAAALRNLSTQAGIAVEALSGLAVVGKATGTGADQIAAASNKLSKALATSNEESKGAATALKALGLSFDTFQKLSPDARMKSVADAMNLFQDGSQKSAAAMLLFGKAGAEILPFLKDLAETGELVARVTTEQANQAHEFEKSLGRLKASSESWKKHLAFELLPTLNDIVDAFTELGKAEGHSSALEVMGEAVKATLQVVAVLAVNTVYIFRQIGNEIGGIAAQVVAFVSGNFDEAFTIGKQMKLDAAAARVEVDKLSSSLLGLTNSKAGAGRGRDAWQDPRVAAAGMAPGPDFRTELTGLAGNGNATAAAASDFDKLSKSLSETIAQQNLELQAETQLSAGQKEAAKIMENLRTGVIHLSQSEATRLAKLLETLLAQEKSIDQHKRETDAVKAANEAHLSYINTLVTERQTAEDQLQRQIEANDVIGLSKNALAAYQAAKMQDAATTAQIQAIKKLDRDGDEIAYNLTMDRVKAMRELAGATVTGAAKQTMLDDAKAAADEWKRTNDEINRTLTDALMNAFESGTGFGRAFVKTIEDMFKTMVLRPVISAIVSPVSQAIGGGVNSLLGIGGNAAGSSLLGSGGLFGGGSLANSGGIVGAFAQGYSGSAAIGTGSSFASTVGGGLATDAMGAGVAEEAAAAGIETGIGAGVEAGLAAVPVVGWIALAGMALYSIFGNSGGGPKTEGGYNPNSAFDLSGTDAGGGHPGGVRGDVASAQQIAQGFTATLNTAAAAFGVAIASDVGVFYAKDPQGTSQTQLQVVSQNYNRSDVMGGIENVGRSDSDFSAAVSLAAAQLTLVELQKAVQGKEGEFLRAADVKGMSTDQITALIQTAENAHTMFAAFAKLGPAFDSVTQLTVDDMTRLVTAFGGMQAAGAKLSSYYANFYSDAEKKANVVADIVSKLNAAGLTITADQVAGATREQFRGLVEQEVALGSNGETAAQALLNVNDEFASITPSADEASKALSGVAEQLFGGADAAKQLGTDYATNAKNTQDFANAQRAAYGKALADLNAQRNSLSQQLLQLVDPAAAVAKSRKDELAAMNTSLWPLQQEIWRRQDLAAATNAANSELAAMAERTQSLVSPLQQAVDSLQKFLDTLENQAIAALSGNQGYDTAKAAVSSASPEQFQAAAQTFLQAASTHASTQADYQRDVAFVEQAGHALQDKLHSQIDDIMASSNAAVSAYLAAAQAQAAAAVDAADLIASAAGALGYAAALSPAQIATQMALFGHVDNIYGTAPDGSHAAGLDRVPFDGYKAILHKNERVLTASQARASDDWARAVRTGSTAPGSTQSNPALEALVRDVLNAIGTGNYQARRAADLLDTWDGKGLLVRNSSSDPLHTTTS